MKKITTLFACFCILLSQDAQALFVKDTLSLFARPMGPDSFEVYLVVKGYFGSYCNLDCSQTESLSDTLDTRIGYYVGNAIATCTRNDTLSVGTFHAHLINVKLTIGEGVIVNCDSFYRKQQYTLSLLLQNTAVQEINLDKIVLFPNPTSGLLKISTSENLQQTKVEVLSATGAKLISGVYDNRKNFEIDVSTLPAGIYFLQLSDEKQRVVRKFVKE